MPLMPVDVAAVAFSKPPLGKRGYDEDEVDAFLDVVEAELARLIQENTDLRTRVELLEQQPVATGGDRRLAESLGPPSPPPLREQTLPGGDHNAHAARVLGLAQEMADRLTGEAKAEADGMLSHARVKSEQLLSGARAKAEGMVTEARTRSETMLNEARTKTASLERDAAAKHTEIIAGLCQEKGILEKEIDELRTFERGYRSRLKTYLDSQLRELGGRGSAAPADPMHTTQQDLVGSGFGAHAEAGSR
jgi:DivIVA domain-containing protein